MTFTEQFDCWDRKNSTYDPEPMTLGGESYEIYTYSLDESLLDQTPLESRLLFKMGATTDGKVVCHQNLFRLFARNGDTGAWVHPNRVLEEMDNLSKAILWKIQNDPTQAPLTSLAKYFKAGSKIGCGGVDKVREHKEAPCPCERNHKGQQGAKQKNEKITFDTTGTYQLKTGQ